MKLKNMVRRLFHKNMKAVCVYKMPHYTVGKEYEVLEIVQYSPDWVCFKVINDDGEEGTVNRDKFKY